MSEYELQWLAEQASTHKFIVEIGSYAGRSTWALAKHTSGKVVAIDDFLGADTDRPLSKEESNNLTLEFRKNLQEFIDKKKLFILHPDDLKTAKGQGTKPDMVFIDGDHSYEGVSADIKYWGANLQPGGLLCGHDSGHPPIQQALKDLIPDVKYQERTAIWYTIKD